MAGMKWWKLEDEAHRAGALLDTAAYLKEYLNYRYRQASIYSRLYSNIPLYSFLGGGTMSKMSNLNQLPVDRPTMNVVQSCVDTLVSRLSQSKPRPIFLTDNGDYRQRNLAKQLNQFIVGELYSTKAYQLGELLLRDAAVLGTGCLKIYETKDHKVALERVLYTELLVDPSDSLYGDPRQLYQLKLVDRDVLIDMFPEEKEQIERAERAYPDNSADSSKSVSDQVMVVEGWHLPSGPGAKDGRHMIAVDSCCLVDEEYERHCFPFVFLNYSSRLLGFFGQGLAEQLMGTQMEINKLLITISQAINLTGVPRIFVESGSKVVKAHLNNQVGAIVTYQGTKPIYEVAPCMPGEVYGQLQRLIDYAYQQSGISALSAASQKPAGLDSGAALREYDDLQSDRFAALSRRYDNLYVDMAYQIIDLAKSIAEREGEYKSVYPDKDGTQTVDLPAAKLLDNTFVIQCYDSSMLPKDPAGRKQTIVEDMQAGIVSPQEGRRLLNYPDLEQDDKLTFAAEERILKVLDGIALDGKYTPPDPFMDLQMALTKSVQYYNMYAQVKLEESKLMKLRLFNQQVQDLLQAANPPPMAAPGAPLAAPEAPPTSPQVPLATAQGQG